MNRITIGCTYISWHPVNEIIKIIDLFWCFRTKYKILIKKNIYRITMLLMNIQWTRVSWSVSRNATLSANLHSYFMIKEQTKCTDKSDSQCWGKNIWKSYNSWSLLILLCSKLSHKNVTCRFEFHFFLFLWIKKKESRSFFILFAFYFLFRIIWRGNFFLSPSNLILFDISLLTRKSMKNKYLWCLKRKQIKKKNRE